MYSRSASAFGPNAPTGRTFGIISTTASITVTSCSRKRLRDVGVMFLDSKIGDAFLPRSSPALCTSTELCAASSSTLDRSCTRGGVVFRVGDFEVCGVAAALPLAEGCVDLGSTSVFVWNAVRILLTRRAQARCESSDRPQSVSAFTMSSLEVTSVRMDSTVSSRFSTLTLIKKVCAPHFQCVGSLFGKISRTMPMTCRGVSW
mmetsp:Transcript_6327/g.12648  ORF Transcript_6327/g.12648 Transcript_6327/m.12648 type:complete len:203 (-) Transcript_6327:342-950(-)